jgi:hypothetical protein
MNSNDTILTKSINPIPDYVSVKDSSTKRNFEIDNCKALKEKILALDKEKNLDKNFELRFKNIHKEIDGKIYRLRFFMKEHNQGEYPRYLLYEEDQNEDAHIIENTAYEKGPNFKKIENSQGEIIYSEKGLLMGEESHSLFIHFVNDQLKDLQGFLPDFTNQKMMDCQY